MTSEELNRVHRRYIRISSAFKSAWTFHQFIQGVYKVFDSLTAPDYPADFQNLYGEIKQVSSNLAETTLETATAQLDRIEEELAPLVQALLIADEAISPGQLRMFFQRVKAYDDNILTHLVKFYLYSKDSDGWILDRLDKADFLATKLAEEYHDSRQSFVLRDPTFVREAAQSFWAALGAEPVPESAIEGLLEEIRGISDELAETASIDGLHQQGLIARYRELKHRLGDLFFQPQVLGSILESNLALKNQIHRLYRRDEERIIAEYQHVFELERDAPFDVELGAELAEFRSAVDRFERQLEGRNLRLEELAELRRKVRELVPKLQPATDVAGTGAFVPPPEPRQPAAEQETAEAAPAVVEPIPLAEDDYVRDQFDMIVGALDDTNAAMDARKVALQPEIFGIGLGAREIISYRRLFGSAPCNQELEQFILRGAALRARIEQEVEEIKSILDDTAVTREAPVFSKARTTARLADLYLRQFEHRLEHAILEGDSSEARALQVLKMRMMRAYSGLWLMVYRT